MFGEFFLICFFYKNLFFSEYSFTYSMNVLRAITEYYRHVVEYDLYTQLVVIFRIEQLYALLFDHNFDHWCNVCRWQHLRVELVSAITQRTTHRLHNYTTITGRLWDKRIWHICLFIADICEGDTKHMRAPACKFYLFYAFCRIPFFSWFRKLCHFTWYFGNCIGEQVIEWACHHRIIFFCLWCG